MKTKRIESMAFLREYFRIPKYAKTNWCIIEEKNADKIELRLGMQIGNSNLYIDVADRFFHTAGTCARLVRTLYSARKVAGDVSNVFYSNGERYLELELPKHYIADIYYPAVYQKSLFDDELF